MIYSTVPLCRFTRELSEVSGGHFSLEGMEALYFLLDNESEQNGKGIEFDPVTLCCDYTEYSSVQEFAEEYHDFRGMSSVDAVNKLRKLTTVLRFDTDCGKETHLIVKGF